MLVENARLRAWAEIDLDAIAHNTRAMRALIQKSTKMMAVVKANAYGHGAFEVAKTALENGADYLGVATAEEALELRMSGIGAPILILGLSPATYAEELVKNEVAITVDSVHQAMAVSAAAQKAKKTARIHLAIDTGMSRIGFGDDDQAADEIASLVTLPNLVIEGIFTHFSKADEKEKSATALQFSRFMGLIKKLTERGVEIPLKHVCNSAAAIDCPAYHLDMVRVGIALYGCYPSEEVEKSRVELVSAMSFRARIARIDTKPEGIMVSYGGIYETKKETAIATITVGYADGYTRTLSGKAEVIAGDCCVPQIGRICMDQCMIDVTGVNNIAVGDEVILFGKRGDQVITAATLGMLSDTIDYEILCSVGARVPRIYLTNGVATHVLWK